jgi:hypothetical protein
LILRRVGLLETGVGGPIIVGRADNADVLRLQGFLRRNGHPHQLLNPETDDEAKALIERFHIGIPRHLKVYPADVQMVWPVAGGRDAGSSGRAENGERADVGDNP